MCLCVYSQDHPRPHLQCSEAFHGDESEALWRLHTAVQGWEKQVGTTDSFSTRFIFVKKKRRCLSDLIAISLKHCCRSGVGFHINQRKRADLMTQSLFFVFFNPRNREKAKSKEREEAWVKIENLAKSNPQVSACNHLTNPWFSFTTNVCWVRVYRTNIYEISVLCFVEL